MRRLLVSATALAAGLGLGSAMAQDAIELGEIVVLSNRTPTEAGRVGVSTSVLTADDIEAQGDVELLAVLRRLPGVSVTQNGPVGSAANLRIRGADSRYIAVYVDGIRVDDPSSVQTQFDFGGLTAADISRVELLRGSQSALYGGSAVGGVIAITTRRADTDGFAQSAEVEAGSFGTVRGSYGLSTAGESGSVALTLSHVRTDGFSAAEEAAGNSEKDGYRATRLSFSAEHRLSESLVVGGAAFLQDGTIEYDGYDPITFDPADADNTTDRTETGARVFARIETGRTEHLLDLSYYRIDRDNDEEGFLSAFSGRRLGISWQGTTGVSPDLTLVYGLDTMREKAVTSALPAEGQDSTTSGAFAQALWAPSADLDVSASARVDDVSNFGTFTSGRLALAYRPTDTLTLRAAAARGFRAPSIDERFSDYGWFVGNPDLEPEESVSFEIGAEAQLAGGTVSATLFRLEIDNHISYDGGVFPATLQNLPGTSVREGVELAASLPLSERFDLDLGYTYIDARNSSGAKIQLVPEHAATLGVNFDIAPRLSGRAAVEHASGAVDFFGELPGYTVANVGFDYALTDRASLTLRVENLFDEQYQRVRGYGTAGRSVYVGLGAQF